MTNLYQKTAAAALWPIPNAALAATDYCTDAWQRTILTWDVLRERGNQYIEHEKSGKPPVLVFDHEIVVDGRGSSAPRITRWRGSSRRRPTR